MTTQPETTVDGAEALPTGKLDRQFALTARGTTVRTEVLAGVTTFLTMAASREESSMLAMNS